jgi:hypothetical protein
MKAQKPEYGTAGGLHTEQRETNTQSARLLTIFLPPVRGSKNNGFLISTSDESPQMPNRMQTSTQ